MHHNSEPRPRAQQQNHHIDTRVQNLPAKVSDTQILIWIAAQNHSSHFLSDRSESLTLLQSLSSQPSWLFCLPSCLWLYQVVLAGSPAGLHPRKRFLSRLGHSARHVRMPPTAARSTLCPRRLWLCAGSWQHKKGI